MKKAQHADRVKVYDQEGLNLLAERLKTVRKQKGFTQEKLADEAGIELSQVARIETAAANATVSTIFRIARALHINVSELFDFSLGSPPPDDE